MKKVKGDLIKLALEGEFDIIVQGCNCFCIMGGGIAKQLRDKFPEVYEVDCETKSGDKSKLGTYTSTFVNDGSFMVINGYTQYSTAVSKDDVVVDYDAVRSVFKLIYDKCKGTDTKIGYPLIGCGLANGDPTIVLKIIDEELKDLDHTLVEWNG